MSGDQGTRNHDLVAAIDFGTTFSGWAYQFKSDYETGPTKVFSKNWNNGSNISCKAPTTLLINPDGKTLDSFGYEAEDKFAELSLEDAQDSWFYFSQFKMKLFMVKRIRLRMMLDAHNKRQLPALLVFRLAIDYLKTDLMREIQHRVKSPIYDRDVLWVLTVPAIWTDRAKQFMRQAAIDVSRTHLSYFKDFMYHITYWSGVT